MDNDTDDYIPLDKEGRHDSSWRARLRSTAGLKRGEIRAVLLLLPLLAVMTWIMLSMERPHMPDHAVAADGIANGAADTAAEADGDTTADSAELFPFDPNTADIYQLCRLGLSQRAAAAVIKYRERGKVFEIPEDLATCYGISLDDYRRLEPYISIGPRFRLKPQQPAAYRREEPSAPAGRPSLAPAGPFRIDTAGVATLMAAGLTLRQARTLINYRDKCGGIYGPEELRRCYAIDEELARRLETNLLYPARPEPAAPAETERTEERDGSGGPTLLEINGATHDELLAVRGIGEVTAEAIIDYRTKLGGFSSAQQLAEIKSVTERNFERILQQISVDSCKIRKIDINFATPEEIGSHPYVTPLMLRKILKQRQLKGGWERIEEMLDDKILSGSEAARLAPYLRFDR